MIHRQVPRNPKFRLAEKQALENKYLLQQLVLNAAFQPTFSTHIVHAKIAFEGETRVSATVYFFLHMKWIALMFIVFGVHEDCVFYVNTHTQLGSSFWCFALICLLRLSFLISIPQ